MIEPARSAAGLHDGLAVAGLAAGAQLRDGVEVDVGGGEGFEVLEGLGGQHELEGDGAAFGFAA